MHKNIACISDIHLGVHQDAATWHKLHLDYALWLKTTLTDNDIHDIIIAGDVFHNRHEIGVSTLHTAKLFFETLSNFNIHIIPGNHDCYFRDNAKVNSISILHAKNITIHNTLHCQQIGDIEFAFCPWGTELEDIPNVDVIIGHFELLNFKMNMNIVCDHGWNSSQLLEKSKLVLTGHFHTRQERTYGNNGVVVYLGSPLELEWGDRDSAKGVTILNTKNLSLNFIENDISPKHIKIKISELQNNTINIKNLKKYIKGNHVKIIVDVKFADANVDALLYKLNTFEPLQLKVEYELPAEDAVDIDTLEQTKMISIESTIREYVNALEVAASKEDVYSKCIEYLNLFQHNT